MDFIRKIKNIVETNQLVSLSFDTIASTSIYRHIINYKIKSYVADIKKNKDYNVIIESSNFCNAKCIMCPHSTMNRPRLIMNEDTFNLVLRRLTNENIYPTAFLFNGFGEPMTDTKLISRINTVKKLFPNSTIKIYSNFGIATPASIKQILRSGLDEINISFNGYDSKNYQETMKIDYFKTLKNIKELLKLRMRYKSNLKIRISMTLVKQNEKKIKSFLKYWTPKVDSVSVNKVHTYNQSVPDTSSKFKINFKKIAFPCKYIFNTIVITNKGDISLCCLDYEARHTYGNIKDKTILDIFYSPAFENVRKLHLENQLKKMPICANCYTPYKNGVEWLINKLY
jgi:radical SAM protein with 4Fe4S-binding SPASM domain